MGNTKKSDKRIKEAERKKKEDRIMNIAAVVFGVITLAAIIVAIVLNTDAGLFRQPGSVDTDKEATVATPVYDGDLVVYGMYPQSEVSGNELTQDIVDASYDSNHDAEVDGVMYRRIAFEDVTYPLVPWETEYRYFVYEPVKWRVLYNQDGQMLLISDMILDCQYYETEAGEFDWLSTDAYAWLNGEFKELAFTKDEQASIKATSAGEIFLLSDTELGKYMLVTGEFDVEDVKVYTSDYASAMGVKPGIEEGDANWYLRGEEAGAYTVYTGSSQGLAVMSVIFHSKNEGVGIRPAIVLNVQP